MKAQARHLADARRQRNECPDHRQQSPDQNRCCAKAMKEMLGAVQFMASHKYVRTIALNQRPAAITADFISNNRTQITADSSCRGGPEQIEAAGVNQVSGKGHDDF